MCCKTRIAMIGVITIQVEEHVVKKEFLDYRIKYKLWMRVIAKFPRGKSVM
jgi:hypothetical protein